MISASSPGSSGVPESNQKVQEVVQGMENNKQEKVVESKEKDPGKGVESKEEISRKGVESKEKTPKWVSVA